MYLIEQGLWQGEQVETLPNGIQAVVNLCCTVNHFHDDAVCQVMLPIADGPFPGVPWLKMAVGIIEKLREAKLSVYVHCREGVSRSVMLTAAYLMRRHRWKVDAAMEWIATANPKLNPSRDFMRGLREWEQELGIG